MFLNGFVESTLFNITKQPRTIEANIKELKPHPNNKLFPISRHKVEQIKKEIQDHGFSHPISITPDKVILSGHKRVIACKELGYSTIPAYVITKKPEAQLLYFIRQNTITDQITSKVRNEIYKLYCKEIFVGKNIREDKIIKLSKVLAISPNIIKADFAKIRKGEVKEVTVDVLVDIWNKKIANPKITFTRGDIGWICQIADRNFNQAFGPFPLFKDLVKIVFDAGISRHFQTEKGSDESINNGLRIKEIRKKYSVNQEELAEAMNRSQSTICEWERGLRIYMSEDEFKQIELACQKIAGVYEKEKTL